MASTTDTRSGSAAVASVILVGVIGGWASVIMPGLLSALTAAKGITPAGASILGSTELVGMTIAIVASAFFIERIRGRRLVTAAICALAIGQFLSMQVGSYALLVGTRLLTGLGEGALVTAMSVAASRMPSPDKIFGLYLAALLGASTVFFHVLPDLTGAVGARGVFGALAALAIVSAVALAWFPNNFDGPAVTVGPPAKSRSFLLRVLPAVLGLLATLLLLMGFGAFWPLVGQIAISRGIDVADANGAMAMATFSGIASGLFVSRVGTRAGRKVPLIVGSSALIATIALFLVTSQVRPFTLLTVSFMFWWILTIPYYIGVMAELDRTGKLASFSFATQTFGIALGQALSAYLVRGVSYTLTMGASIVLIAFALVGILFAISTQTREAH